VCQGKMMRYEQRYRNDEMLQRAIQDGELVWSHEHRGWTAGTLASQYLHWLHRDYGEQSIALLWDVFALHRCDEAKKLVPESKIELEPIPLRIAGNCQQLDRWVFRNLKTRVRSRFDRLCINQNGDSMMQDSVAMMIYAWKSTGQDKILDAWDLQPA
jgi:hypothetical protein